MSRLYCVENEFDPFFIYPIESLVRSNGSLISPPQILVIFTP